MRINLLLEPIIFADDTVVIIYGNFDNLYIVSNIVVPHMSKWFGANKLVLLLIK